MVRFAPSLPCNWWVWYGGTRRLVEVGDPRGPRRRLDLLPIEDAALAVDDRHASAPQDRRKACQRLAVPRGDFRKMRAGQLNRLCATRALRRISLREWRLRRLGPQGLSRNSNGDRDGAQLDPGLARLRSLQRGFEGAFFMPEQRLSTRRSRRAPRRQRAVGARRQSRCATWCGSPSPSPEGTDPLLREISATWRRIFTFPRVKQAAIGPAKPLGRSD